jgi:Protein of unknown function (DUF4231)
MRLVVLFKRLPKLRWVPPQKEDILSAAEQKSYPDLAADFAVLEKELMPYFRKFDTNALRLQNQFRLHQVTLILGGALATILGALHATLEAGIVSWIAISEALLAAILSGVAFRAQSTRAQERYATERLKAEKLRSEYFLFLGRVGSYANDDQRLPQLIRHIGAVQIGESK